MADLAYPRLGETVCRRTLGNGMEVLVVPKPFHQRAHAYFAVRYGGMDQRFQRDGQWLDTPAGIAHYLEHKMFDTEDGSALRDLAKNGAVDNAFTAMTSTVYYFESTDHFYENLRILLDFVSVPYFTQESVDKERGIIEQEIRMGEDDPDWRLYDSLMKCMYTSPALSTAIAGTVDSIQSISPDTLYACHGAFYTPSNMVLVCVGNVNIDRVVEAAEEILPKTSGSKILRDYGNEEPEPCRKKAVLQMDVSMPQFLLGYKCAPLGTGMEALRRSMIGDLASEIIFGTSSPLFTRLYENGKNNGSLGGGFTGQAELAFVAVGGEAADAEDMVQEIQSEIAAYQKDGVPEALWEQIRRALYGRMVRQLNSLENIALGLINGVFDEFDYMKFPEVFDTITKGDVESFIRNELRPDRAALSLILPLNEKDK